ncbi:MAG: UDP-2,4-diacetamido-2,4,6-trideoxy-beta-L-altropyranose hydrolase [Candidatus Aminicenantales bacterium]
MCEIISNWFEEMKLRYKFRRPEYGTLVIRTDASANIGAGHIMRCFALAQAWQLEGSPVVFLSHCESDVLRQRIADTGMEFIPIAYPHPDPRDLVTTLETLRTRSAGIIGNPTWLVLDGYHFDAVYQQAVRTTGHRLLVIDDMAHLPSYSADILLNQNLGAEKLKYNCDPDTTLLLGSRYALLRQEFLAWHGRQRKIPDVARKVLVTTGGGDPDNVTLKVIQALQKVGTDDLETVVAAGSSNPHVKMLQSEVQLSRIPIRLEHDVLNMPEQMAWADLAISAGGSTCWELAFMGVPNLIIMLADNQRLVAENLQAAGISVILGLNQNLTSAVIGRALNQLLGSPAKRTEMTSQGQSLVDGNGCERIIMHLRGDKFWLRPVCAQDCRFIWEWANDPITRAVSFSSEPISWEQHIQWFDTEIKDPNCIFFLAINEYEEPIGQIRFDLQKPDAIISVSLAAPFRGKGFGSKLIYRASQRILQKSDISVIHAYIKPGNEGSRITFIKAGFKQVGSRTVKDHEAIHFSLTKDD